MYFLQTITSALTLSPTTWARRDSWNASVMPSFGLFANHTSSSSPQIVEVLVGAAGRLSFNPDSVSVATGTILRFNFLALNHTLTQSTLSHPCVNSSQFDSGFHQFNPSNISGKFLVDFEVTSNDSQWFYCAQDLPRSHCHSGMVFSLNPSSSHDAFIHNAIETTASAEITQGPSLNYCSKVPNASGGRSTYNNGTASQGFYRPSIASITPGISSPGKKVTSGLLQLLGGLALILTL